MTYYCTHDALSIYKYNYNVTKLTPNPVAPIAGNTRYYDLFCCNIESIKVRCCRLLYEEHIPWYVQVGKRCYVNMYNNDSGILSEPSIKEINYDNSHPIILTNEMNNMGYRQYPFDMYHIKYTAYGNPVKCGNFIIPAYKYIFSCCWDSEDFYWSGTDPGCAAGYYSSNSTFMYPLNNATSSSSTNAISFNSTNVTYMHVTNNSVIVWIILFNVSFLLVLLSMLSIVLRFFKQRIMSLVQSELSSPNYAARAPHDYNVNIVQAPSKYIVRSPPQEYMAHAPPEYVVRTPQEYVARAPPEYVVRAQQYMAQPPHEYVAQAPPQYMEHAPSEYVIRAPPQYLTQASSYY